MLKVLADIKVMVRRSTTLSYIEKGWLVRWPPPQPIVLSLSYTFCHVAAKWIPPFHNLFIFHRLSAITFTRWVPSLIMSQLFYVPHQYFIRFLDGSAFDVFLEFLKSYLLIPLIDCYQRISFRNGEEFINPI